MSPVVKEIAGSWLPIQVQEVQGHLLHICQKLNVFEAEMTLSLVI